MSPIQQMLLGAGGAVATKTYVDDIFSTFLYKGNNTNNHHIQNGVDLTEGGLVWIKDRDQTSNHTLTDSAYLMNTTNKDFIQANTSNPDQTGPLINSFESNGFKLSGEWYANSAYNYSSWTFRKAKGFFDVVTWTGNGVAGRQISHSLSSIPGCIMIKCTSNAFSWTVGHKSLNSGTDPWDYHLMLHNSDDEADGATQFNDTAPTSTHFTVGAANTVNGSGKTYVAYLFAGGESTAATARSVDFDGSDDQLNIPDSADWDLGNGDFTLETWIKSTQTTSGYFTALGQWQDSGNNRSWMIRYASQDIGTGWSFFYSTNGSNYTTTMGSDISDGQWHHIAVTRTGGNLRTFTDGILNTTRSTSDTFYAGAGTFTIGGQSGNYFDGQLSNVRLVKGTALYTSSFRSPTEPLTNVTNTKLLCCNNSSVTGSTVTPGTITASSSPTASTDSPFDDPAGFVFGESGSESVITCGSYVGSGSAGLEVNLGWEPSWIMVKSATSNENWEMYDSMRGLAVGGDAERLKANTTSSEDTNSNWFALTPNGFIVNSTSGSANSNGQTYIYLAIRRPDGYVGKPVELGTGVFAMDTGNSSANGPAFDSNFAVDFTFSKEPASTGYWITTARLIDKWLRLNDTTTEASLSSYERYDLSKGVHQQYNSSNQAFMFKRHAGFDVVTYTGTGDNSNSGPNNSSQDVAHNLGKPPEMIWVKCRSIGYNWYVYHKGQNGGTNPHNYYLQLNSGDPEQESVAPYTNAMWNNTAPTSTHFSLGPSNDINDSTEDYIAMLFASVDGISKVGYYNGTGSSGHSITTGFQPRMIIIKPAYRPDTYGGAWHMFDTVRGINSGNEYPLRLNTNESQTASNHLDYIDLDSDGFTIQSTHQNYNYSGARYIYYAHA